MAELTIGTRPLGDGRSVVSFAGEVDVTNVATFEESLARSVAGGGAVIDLQDLTYLDSAGVAVLFGVARHTSLEVVAGPGSRIRRLLDVVSLDAVATVLDVAPG